MAASLPVGNTSENSVPAENPSSSDKHASYENASAAVPPTPSEKPAAAGKVAAVDTQDQTTSESRIHRAVLFLQHPSVQNESYSKKYNFLIQKGVSAEEISEAVRRVTENAVNKTQSATTYQSNVNVNSPPQALQQPPQSAAMYPTNAGGQPMPLYPPAYPYAMIEPRRSGVMYALHKYGLPLVVGVGLIGCASQLYHWYIRWSQGEKWFFLPQKNKSLLELNSNEPSQNIVTAANVPQSSGGSAFINERTMNDALNNFRKEVEVEFTEKLEAHSRRIIEELRVASESSMAMLASLQSKILLADSPAMNNLPDAFNEANLMTDLCVNVSKSTIDGSVSRVQSIDTVPTVGVLTQSASVGSSPSLILPSTREEAIGLNGAMITPSVSKGQSENGKAAHYAKIQESISVIVQKNSKTSELSVKKCIETLLLLLRNLVESPNDEKYRRVNVGNPRFEERFGASKAEVYQFFELLGFHYRGNSLEYTLDNLVPITTALDILNSVLASLKTAVDVPPKLPLEPTLISTEPSASVMNA